MAPRPQDSPESDELLNREQLQMMTRRLAMLSPQGLADAYRRAHDECRMTGGLPPTGSAVQELVTAWKLLRAWQERREHQELHSGRESTLVK